MRNRKSLFTTLLGHYLESRQNHRNLPRSGTVVNKDLRLRIAPAWEGFG